ncbi:hypothetical protein [Hymenobacter sp. BRD128]|uniref:hypothetical protein n=1 Tax=Hymenobacter sp. BRD128 TaxID=2675878 RepID=UPI0020B74447|nr:hypothetical protein [Hymenobacter sp. BRD128]
MPFSRPDDLALVVGACRGFLADNGAYSYWRKGFAEYPHYEAYVRWVEKIQPLPGFHGAIIPDHIAGDERQNNEYLRRWPVHLTGIPVFHMHHSLDRARWLAQTYDTVALGGGRGYEQLKSASWWARMHEIMSAFCDEYGRPLCRLHGLRMLDPKVFTKFPLASADSVNAARNSGSSQRFAPGLTRGERACLIADRIEQQDAPQVWLRPELLARRQLTLF